MASTQVLADLGRKIFQRLPQRHTASGNKVISKQLKGDKVVQWFNKPIQLRLGGNDPNFEILNAERLGKLDQMKRRGKSIPKKGAGKRSKKQVEAQRKRRTIYTDTMGYNGQSVQTNNKKKIKLHKKKRAEVRNQRKVATLAKGPRTVLRKPRPSKKKLQKDSKRRRIVIDAEKAKLLKSGLITQEDIDKMEADAKDNEDDEEAAEDMEN